jgi:hypothetical protein
VKRVIFHTEAEAELVAAAGGYEAVSTVAHVPGSYHRPDAVADLLEANVLLGEHGTDVYAAIVHGDHAVVLPPDAPLRLTLRTRKCAGYSGSGTLSG